MKDLSIIIPLYNEDESLPELEAWIRKVVTENQYDYEILFVDDGSNDDSWKVIQDLAEKNRNVRGARFRRNYGKSAALYTGFAMAEGNVVITMDADLQDSPDEIPELYNMIARDGFDLVSGWKKKRYDPISKTVPSKFFNWTASKMSGIKLHDFNCGLKAYNKDVIKTVEVYGEMHRYIPYLAKKAGFSKIGEKVVEHRARQYGVTKFGLSRFINGFLDLMSIYFMSKFGNRPMHFFGALGTLIFMIGFFAAGFLGVSKLIDVYNHVDAERITESPYFFLSLVSMILGSQFFLAGFIGELISRNSSEKNKYLIKEEL